jgi:maltose alpha-D-glucosyltransferase/alpha-amylase
MTTAVRIRKKSEVAPLEDDPLWYKDAIIYEVHVRAFCDSNGDGIGDLRGLVEKLDYLQDLGVTALWLLPFYPSPLRDDGYDIADYTDVNSIYGTLNDFKLFMREAHRRGLRVITELVINHTSDQHPWFQRARHAAPGTIWRDFYVWSDTIDRYQDARIMFGEFESSNWTWDPLVKAYYWHRFYAHQPDLNFDNPAVHDAVFDVLDFWLDIGVDGLRLDAVPFLYEREGTTCESLPETHAFLRKLRSHVDERYRNRMLLAEANHWPEEMVSYFGAQDECHMAFHFPLMPRLFMAIRMEERFPIIDILQQTPAIPDSAQWALFLRNHDELTLAMVTAEDRDYMYRMYAQDTHARVHLGIRRRLAPLLENHRGKIELMNGLLFSLPGTPVLYYGDEIGMGDNIYLGDRNGVRTPMQWTPERNAGFSHANPQKLYLPVIIDPEYHHQVVNVEAQQNNFHSLLWWMKRLIALRKRFRAFGRGTLEFLHPDNHKVLVFLRRAGEERILVVANLSRFVQCVELNLETFKGFVPIEMFGWTSMPPITERPYVLTLGPHAFYWLLLEPAPAARPLLAVPVDRLPALEATGAWQDIFRHRTRDNVEAILLGYLRGQRWFAGKGGQPKSAHIVENIPIAYDGTSASILLIQVEYQEGEARVFVLPVAYRGEGSSGQEAARNANVDSRPRTPDSNFNIPGSVICQVIINSASGTEDHTGVLYDPLEEKGFAVALLEAFMRHRRIRASRGELLAWTTPAYPRLRGFTDPRPEPALIKAEQSNTSIAYGDRFVLKLVRCVEEGINLEVEVGRALAEKTPFRQAASVAGALDYRREQSQPMTVATLLGFVPNEGDAWRYTLDSLRRYFENLLTEERPLEKPGVAHEPVVPNRPFLDLVDEELPAQIAQRIGPYVEAARLMGRRTAELHVALASIAEDPAFSPEPFTLLYQRSAYQTVRSWVYRVFNLLRDHVKDLPEQARTNAQLLLGREADLIGHLRTILSQPIGAQRVRTHGDYRLGSLLYTGKDFVVIDFEGEVLRPLSNRRHKRSPLRDVASMLHSLHSAVRALMHEEHLRPEDKRFLEPWARFWQWWVSVAFVKSYLEIARSASFLPRTRTEMQILLDFFLLSRGLFELRYQLLNRPDRAQIPLEALLYTLDRVDRQRALNAGQ